MFKGQYKVTEDDGIFSIKLVLVAERTKDIGWTFKRTDAEKIAQALNHQED